MLLSTLGGAYLLAILFYPPARAWIPLPKRVTDTLKLMVWHCLLGAYWCWGPFLLVVWTVYVPIVSDYGHVMLLWYGIYGLWVAYSWNFPWTGGIAKRYLREDFGPVWWLADYFQHSIVKTAELPPDRNYIIGSHPHGHMGAGTCFTFAWPRKEFRTKFPGIHQRLITVSGNFIFPFRREFSMLTGAVDASKESIDYMLSHRGQGQAIGIAVGGASELIATENHRFWLKLDGRKGFIRAALRNGADLVPMFNFGENEIFKNYWAFGAVRVRNMQARVRNWFSFTPPFIFGTSYFGFPWGGTVPYPSKVTSVMGAPIHVDKVEKATAEEVDALFAVYKSALIDLFESHKGDYGIPPEQHLDFY